MKNPSVLSDTGPQVSSSVLLLLRSAAAVESLKSPVYRLRPSAPAPRSALHHPALLRLICAASHLCRRPCWRHLRAGCWEGCWGTSCLVLWGPRWGSSGGWWARHRWRASRSRVWWRRSGRGSSGCPAPGWGWAWSCPGESCPGPAGRWTLYTAVCRGRHTTRSLLMRSHSNHNHLFRLFKEFTCLY